MASNSETKPPLPPFTCETAQIKVKAAQNAWNTMDGTLLPPDPTKALANFTDRDPAKVKMAYTPDSIWRNRDIFLQGRDEIEAFLTAKWKKELGYRLRKELFAFTDNKIAVQFWYEWHDEQGNWTRVCGLEDWSFSPEGLMRKRMMSANEVKIGEDERWFKDGVDVNTVEISEKWW